MEKLLRLFPLSFAITWRFFFALPLWTLFYLVLIAISVVGFFAIADVIPFGGIFLLLLLPFIATAVNYIVLMHPYLIGIRICLKVLGFQTERSGTRVMTAAIVYGLVEAIVAFVLSVTISAVFILLLYGDLNLSSAWNTETPIDPMIEISRQIGYGTLSIIPLASSAIVLALRAALLPAMANAVAASKGPYASHRLFDGFGSHFFFTLAILIGISGLSTIALPALGDAFEYLGLTTVLVEKLSQVVLWASRGASGFEFSLAHAFVIIVAILVSVWLFSLQCAGAALAYASNRMPSRSEEKAASEAQEALSQEIGDLLRSRMPNHSK